MGFSGWHWFAALSCLLCMGEVQCDCGEEKVEIQGGHYTLTKGLASGSMLVYHCPEGFYPHPALARVCQPNDRWKPAPKTFQRQKCRMVECPDPNVLEYGNVSPPQEKYFVHNETSYECYSGYTLRGSSRRVCLPNGKWSGSLPICSRDSGATCADPGIPPGGSRTGNIFDIDDTVKYTCSSNMFLVGSSERVCQENGQWTGIEPTCFYRHTYDTPREVSEAFGSAIIESLTILDTTNGTQEGRKIRISKNGTLNIYIGVDISESIQDKYLKDARNAVTSLIRKISSFTVTPNYEIAFFSSEIFEVVNIVEFLDNKETKEAFIKKVEDFEVGDRNTAGTDLNLIFKTFLERMAVIKQRVGEEAFKEHRHVIIVFTDGAYNMGGSPAPTLARIKNMVYMNHTVDKETQSREDYLDIYIFAVGAEIFDDDLQPLTSSKNDERFYFRMKDIDNLSEIFDEIIDENEVKGLCGLHKDYNKDNTKTSKREMYPWYADITVQSVDGGGSSKCFGSLVSPEFILTAAHCFKFGNLPSHVTVDIGIEGGRGKKIKHFILHPKYNVSAKVKEGVKEFYDYDIALIQLENHVDYSSTVRPICIPCTQETSDALQLVGESTCKKQEEILLKNHIEALTFLTRTTNIVEEKDVHAKLGDNRDECIRHALQADNNIITAKDPKVAVTDNFLCTGGRSPRRDHISCTGDSGGAVFKNYEHRTIQVGVVSWGNKKKCVTGGLVESDDTSRDFHINLFRVVPFLKSILGNDNQDEYTPLTFLKN
ncbi:complement factor B-like [Anabas testudineus]|uniref:C3/C5 convertase n=1 Tax=Anabas testudineus TaxID=64144 RepID=A0A7N6C248_ANATE|nr:complement factor B-like [Anabas testudineus]